MAKVVVFGSMNMDLSISSERMPNAGETILGYGFLSNAGGKGANQAVAACLLGAETEMIACVGKDVFGDKLTETLFQYGVGTKNVQQVNGVSTGVASNIKCEGDNRILLDSGANISLTPAQIESLVQAVGKQGDVFITQHECNDETTWQAIKTAKKTGMFTIHNPAPAKNIPDTLYKEIDLLVLNQSECEYLTGIYPNTHKEIQEVLGVFAQKGIGTCILTLGKSGSASLQNEKVNMVGSYTVKTVDTTAAGDTYIGAIAATLVQGKTLQEGMQFASMAAALTVTKHGAQQSIPTCEQVKAYFKEELV